jgi:hypothetical protein
MNVQMRKLVLRIFCNSSTRSHASEGENRTSEIAAKIASVNGPLKTMESLFCAYVLRRPTFQWSGPDHWKVINISHVPNFLELNL